MYVITSLSAHKKRGGITGFTERKEKPRLGKLRLRLFNEGGARVPSACALSPEPCVCKGRAKYAEVWVRQHLGVLSMLHADLGQWGPHPPQPPSQAHTLFTHKQLSDTRRLSHPCV